MALQAGDTFTLITPRGASTPFGTAPRIKGYPVKAIFEIGMSEFDSTFVFMPLAEAQTYFNRDGDVNVIEVYLDNADKVDEARAASRTRPGGRSCSPTGASATAPSSARSRSSGT